jgi:hypothetical protein
MRTCGTSFLSVYNVIFQNLLRSNKYMEWKSSETHNDCDEVLIIVPAVVVIG